MAVTVGGDDRVSDIPRRRGAWKVTGPGVQLGVADAFDDDLIEADRRNDETRDGGAPRGDGGVLPEVDESRLPNRSLRLGAFPGRACIASRERAPGVGRAGVQEQRAAKHAEQRADATAHAA